MTPNLASSPQERRVWSARRAALLATTIFSIGAASFVLAPTMQEHAFAQNVTQQAQTVARPIGFADVVEKVKPAVISVSVKLDADPKTAANDDDEASPFPPGSPMERFFRRFGAPDGMMPRGG
ncbi:MAG: serine peptidase, partial [Pseudorhodoplanes sp.]